MKTTTLFITVLLNALATGFFFAWSVSVILGTKKVGDFTYLETMQSINKEILNPVFFVVFFGSLLTLVLSTILHYNDTSIFWYITAATILYSIGTFGVTAFGNVPLNNALEALELSALNKTELTEFRNYYESLWNRLHTLRTLSSLASFTILLVGIFNSK